ncbi:MAG TPA: ferrochelatase [Candidatus Limnocylindrales bacterium]|nr:ferrochelatase [Candidatus Limnocylindrales bacterium]
MPSPDRFGVLLMTYGSPSSLDDVPRYLAAIRGGRPASDDLATEFRRRYAVIGGSPLVPITQAQAAAVEAALDGEAVVRAAMRFSEPTIEQALAELARAGVDEVVAIIMSPQYSPLIMGGYGRAVDAARASLGPDAPAVSLAGDWHAEPGFVAAVADRIGQAIDRLPADERASAPVLLTAHSLPRRVADEEPEYLRQLEDTAERIASAAAIASDRWRFCWQSAGHEPGEWMKPDFADLMPLLAAEGHRSVVVAPVQFLADHLEILYDVDVGAREQAESAGLRFERIESLNTHPSFIAALAAIARATRASDPRVPARTRT